MWRTSLAQATHEKPNLPRSRSVLHWPTEANLWGVGWMRELSVIRADCHRSTRANQGDWHRPSSGSLTGNQPASRGEWRPVEVFRWRCFRPQCFLSLKFSKEMAERIFWSNVWYRFAWRLKSLPGWNRNSTIWFLLEATAPFPKNSLVSESDKFVFSDFPSSSVSTN